MPDSLQYVVALELIEHLEQPSIFLTEVARLLKPAGAFVCTTPLSRSDTLSDPFHVKEYSPHDLSGILSLHFDSVVIKGIYPDWLDILYRRFTRFKRINGTIKRMIDLMSVFHNPFSACVYDQARSTSCRTLVGFGRAR
jgi:hypothetical protein